MARGEIARGVAAGRGEPACSAAAAAELDRLSGLRQNWDGYGAPPIRPGAIEAAKAFVEALPEGLVGCPRPRVVPMSTGGLQFEWHDGRGKTLELEFEAEETIRFLRWDPKGGVEEEATFRTSDINKAVDLIRWFMSGTPSLSKGR